jgi:hypothetical protein
VVVVVEEVRTSAEMLRVMTTSQAVVVAVARVLWQAQAQQAVPQQGKRITTTVMQAVPVR